MASEADFAEAMTLTLGHEGGWYDGSQPRDPNPTMWGITQNTYDGYRGKHHLPQQSVRNISIDERNEIYRAYWDGTCDQLPRLVALAVFDMSINAGPAAARKCVQRALGLNDDGIYGPKTFAAIRAADERVLALSVLLERVWYYNRIINLNATLRPNLKSWIERTASFYANHVRA